MEEAEPQISDLARVQELVKQLGASGERGRAAERELRSLGVEAIPALCTIIENSRLQRRKIQRIASAITSLVFLVNLLIIGWLPKSANREMFMIVVYTMGMTFAIINLAIVTMWTTPAAQALSWIDDVKATGPLLDALQIVSRDRDREKIHDVLTRLLPHLQASDVSLLTKEQQQTLVGQAGMTVLWPDEISLSRTAYGLALFAALEQVGNATALPVVERCAEKVKNAKVRAAAKACLPFLQERAVQGGQMLLRPASETVSTSTLLRADIKPLQSEPQELLRAATSERNE